ncbi:hypothetical protein [Nocardia sp. CY41]|uniref:hypothetical protein n=1 Tax=Nocardia sp. CY41 TaxID=2608686 RepID=UPI0013584C14|nr:hypothetical protein [Nocardia sp. CY41]
MSDDGREVIETREFVPIPDETKPGWVKTQGGQMSPQYIAYLQQIIAGKVEESGPVPEMDPEIVSMAEELAVIHLPEWLNPLGRKLAEPTVTSMKQAIRVAEYLHKRGWRAHPEHEQIRWLPTPGGMPGPYDTGLHIERNEDGSWPEDPDPERFWDIEAIEVRQLPNGKWGAAHPRGIGFEATTKSEAYAGLVNKIREKIEEATNG